MTKILAFGNSLTAGFGLRPGQAFPDQLTKALKEKGYPVKILNAGISGDTVTGGLNRLDTWLGKSPDLIIVELGVNDAFMGLSLTRIQFSLDQILKKCLDSGAKTLLTRTIPPLEPESNYLLSYNQIFEDLANKYKLPLFPDFLEDIVGNQDLTLMDGVHPNAKGIALTVKKILPWVIDLIQGIKEEQA